jgi:hypothetical protein
VNVFVCGVHDFFITRVVDNLYAHEHWHP